MINTVQVEAKIPIGSKVEAFTRNNTKFVSFNANLTLKVKITSFQIHLKHLDAQKTVQVVMLNLKCFNF